MYVIIVGAGEIGTPLIRMLMVEGHDIVVVEKDATTANDVAQNFDCLVLNADATYAETLEEASAERADAIISTTDVDATNMMVMLLADELDIASRVSVVHNEEHMPLFRRIGANVIENPQRLIAEHLHRAVNQPMIKDVLHLAGEAEIFEITVTSDAPMAGMTLQAADERGLLGDDDVLVVAIERGNTVIMPKGGTEIQAGDLVTIFSMHGFVPEVTSRFAPQEVRT